MNVVTQFPSPRSYDDLPDYRAIFESAAIGIAICRLDGRIFEANAAISRMLGYTPQQLAGSHDGVFYPLLCRVVDRDKGLDKGPDKVPDEDRETDRNTVQKNERDNSSPDKRLLGETLRGERESFAFEKRYRRQDGSEFWGSLTVSLGRDALCQPAFLIAILADVTERRRVEEHLREAAKMEVIGRLAGGIAHDFNNLLTGILLYCDLLSAQLNVGNSADTGLILPNKDVPTSDPHNGGPAHRALARSVLSQHVDELRIAGEQGAALTRQLLAIARKQAAEPRPILLNEVVASTENLLRRLIGAQIELVVALDSSAGLVLADPAQLLQVLMNLVLNARDALPPTGKDGKTPKIWLLTRSTEFPAVESQARFSDAVRAAANSDSAGSQPAVSLTVKDNGDGMNAETRARLFEPFFTTKNPGKGTGLGLATVQRIVTEAGGEIAVESEEGCGTSIAVFFPAIEPATPDP